MSVFSEINASDASQSEWAADASDQQTMNADTFDPPRAQITANPNR